MRKDTIATRNKIISTAERLFAEQGIDAVSLNEITRAAEQKNKSALSYHFGSKEGLLQAIIDKHNPRVLEVRDSLLDGLEKSHAVTPEGLARAMVYALADKLDDDQGGRYYLNILAQLAGANKVSLFTLMPNYTSQEDRLVILGKPFLNEIPEELRVPRLLQATNMLLHSLSYLARVMDKKDDTESLKSHGHIKQVFVDNLVDGLVAITSVTPSDATRLSLAEAI